MLLCRLLMIAVVLELCFGSQSIPNILAYAKYVAKHFEQHQTGVFKCVTLNIRNHAEPDDGFADLLQYVTVTVGSQYVISNASKLRFRDLPPYPSLIITLITSEKLTDNTVETTRRTFEMFDSNSYIMVLTNLTDWNNLHVVNMILTHLRFNYVVYIGITDPSTVIRFDIRGQTRTVLDQLPHPSTLFQSSVRNLKGRAFRFATFCRMSPVSYNWIALTAGIINATVSRLNMPCSWKLHESMAKAFQLGVDITLSKISVGQLPADCYRWIPDVMPDKNVIIIPKGRPFNTIEIFKAPFTWRAWCVLLIVLILVELVGFAKPTLFKDDPILLLLCGCERVNLHRTQGYQKLVYLPLMVFFFLMSNAYGTKIISILTNKPSVTDVTTVEQLINSGIKVKANFQSYPRLAEDSRWASVLVNSTDDILHLDGVHAYMGHNSRQAEFLIHLPMSYDFVLRRPKYTILEEHQELSLLWFMVGTRTPLRELFYFTQKALYESGILQQWYRILFAEIVAEQHASLRDKTSIGLQGLLQFDDLVPAWIALAVGQSLSVMLFVGELSGRKVLRAVGRLAEIWQKLKTVKTKWQCRIR
ncbi:hypothetical protein RP20_CCG014627 [Aedes albopictus]|nr:hypothetical protein RP20_CCG014627 [Aedes albopictus]